MGSPPLINPLPLINPSHEIMNSLEIDTKKLNLIAIFSTRRFVKLHLWDIYKLPNFTPIYIIMPHPSFALGGGMRQILVFSPVFTRVHIHHYTIYRPVLQPRANYIENQFALLGLLLHYPILGDKSKGKKGLPLPHNP